MIDERTEHLINRQIDGELTSDEQLELNKRLIRSPEARAMSEEYQQFDTLAREALHGFCQKSRTEPEIKHQSRFTTLTRGSALAAAVILFAFMSMWLFPSKQQQAVKLDNGTMIASLPIVKEIAQLASIEGPRHERERVQKDLIGVFDRETQSVYLLEMDQQQTTVVPVSMNY